MSKQKYFLILKTMFSSEIFFIRNKNLPICCNCLHFIEHTNNYPYDPLPSDKTYGRCKKFGEVNMITCEIEYDLARNCRLNDNKCGHFASEYTEEIKS
jgi:hypothetical protein